MPRLVYLCGVALVLLAGAFLLARELTWRPGVTADNVRRIKAGMTLEEVEALLGEEGTLFVDTRDRRGRWRLTVYTWDSGAGAATVRVRRGEGGRVEVIGTPTFAPKQSGPLDPLRRAFGPGE
jgi:hypothetical protein